MDAPASHNALNTFLNASFFSEGCESQRGPHVETEHIAFPLRFADSELGLDVIRFPACVAYVSFRLHRKKLGGFSEFVPMLVVVLHKKTAYLPLKAFIYAKTQLLLAQAFCCNRQHVALQVHVGGY